MPMAMPTVPRRMETPKLSHLSSSDYDSIYEPAEDSFLFLDALEDDLDFLRALRPLVCAELGSGSGVVVAALASCLGEGAKCLGVDVSPAACLATARTADKNAVAVEAVCADLGSCLGDGAVDLLLFNPPYVPTESAEVGADGISRAWAGGKDGREVIDRLLTDVGRLLSQRGVFYMVLLAENRPDQVAGVMRGLGFDAKIVKERRVRGEHLFVARYSRSADPCETEDAALDGR